MTAKRFEINKDMNLDNKVETYELSCLVDNSNKTFYFIVDSIANVESFVERLNELHEENIQLREHFIYLIATALEDKECRKIYAKGLLEIFDNCSNLDEAKNKIKEYLE